MAYEMDEFLIQIEKYRNEFYRYVLRNVWDSGVADDVFASGVLAAYKSRDNFKGHKLSCLDVQNLNE